MLRHGPGHRPGQARRTASSVPTNSSCAAPTATGGGRTLHLGTTLIGLGLLAALASRRSAVGGRSLNARHKRRPAALGLALAALLGALLADRFEIAYVAARNRALRGGCIAALWAGRGVAPPLGRPAIGAGAPRPSPGGAERRAPRPLGGDRPLPRRRVLRRSSSPARPLSAGTRALSTAWGSTPSCATRG